MAEGGQKLSKRLKNYPDPNDILETIGSDALRWFLISSPVLKGGNVAVDKEGKEIAKASRKALILRVLPLNPMGTRLKQK